MPAMNSVTMQFFDPTQTPMNCTMQGCRSRLNEVLPSAQERSLERIRRAAQKRTRPYLSTATSFSKSWNWSADRNDFL
jgi:hypothetical protein